MQVAQHSGVRGGRGGRRLVGQHLVENGRRDAGQAGIAADAENLGGARYRSGRFVEQIGNVRTFVGALHQIQILVDRCGRQAADAVAATRRRRPPQLADGGGAAVAEQQRRRRRMLLLMVLARQ